MKRLMVPVVAVMLLTGCSENAVIDLPDGTASVPESHSVTYIITSDAPSTGNFTAGLGTGPGYENDVGSGQKVPWVLNRPLASLGAGDFNQMKLTAEAGDGATWVKCEIDVDGVLEVSNTAGAGETARCQSNR